jgi:hypothetical protein
VRRQGLETPNPRIKSPLLSSILLSYLVTLHAGTCRELPDCAAGRESGGRAVPAATGPYRDIRANMEQPWARSFAQAADTVRNAAC